MDAVFLKYVYSHLYDIYSVLAGMMTLVLVTALKIPVKRLARKMAERGSPDTLPEKERESRRRRIYRRWNGLVFLLVMAVAPLMFLLTVLISGQITFRWGSAGMSGMIAVAAYGILDQIT